MSSSSRHRCLLDLDVLPLSFSSELRSRKHLRLRPSRSCNLSASLVRVERRTRAVRKTSFFSLEAEYIQSTRRLCIARLLYRKFLLKSNVVKLQQKVINGCGVIGPQNLESKPANDDTNIKFEGSLQCPCFYPFEVVVLCCKLLEDRNVFLTSGLKARDCTCLMLIVQSAKVLS